MNSQDVIREVYDGGNKALKIVGNLSASLGGNVTLNPSGNFIGIVTVANPGSAALTGNVTITDGKTYIGLVTSTLGASSAFIGIVTVANSQVNTGNVTLNTSPNFIGLVTVVQSSSVRSIVGNVTLTDAKTFIGLTTSTLGASPAFIGIVTVANPGANLTGNVTITDGKTYIGLTTSTLGIGTQFIGLVTAYIGNGMVTVTLGTNLAAATDSVAIGGNVTLSDSKTFIGLTTSTLGASPAFVGIVTVANKDRTLTGNVTLSDAKTYIGLVSTTATIRDTFASLATLTMSLASLATSSVGVGRQSTLIDNTTARYTSAMVYLKVWTGVLAHTPNSLLNVYLLRGDNNTIIDDNAGASDAALTVKNAPLLGNIQVTASTASVSYNGVFDTSPLGPLGPQWGIALVNVSGAALGGIESNHLKNYIGINRSLG